MAECVGKESLCRGGLPFLRRGEFGLFGCGVFSFEVGEFGWRDVAGEGFLEVGSPFNLFSPVNSFNFGRGFKC